MEQRWLRHAVKEIRSLKSFDDVRHFSEKLLFLLSRMRGGFVKGTKAPPALQIEPTNTCNLRCTCCSGCSNKRKRGYMDFGFFCRIIDEAADVGVRRVHLYLHGEPLLHRHIGEMVRHIKSRGLAVTLATNGVLLNQKKVADLMQSGMTTSDYVLLSVLGHSRETHEKVMKGVNHDRVVANIHNFVRYRNEHKLNAPFIETVFFCVPENAGEEKQYYDCWRNVVDNARVVHSSLQYSSFRSGRFQGPMRTKTCHQLWERMTIHWNGDVALCHADIDGHFILGNLADRSINELWNCERVSRVRQLHRESNFSGLPMCAACDW